MVSISTPMFALSSPSLSTTLQCERKQESGAACRRAGGLRSGEETLQWRHDDDDDDNTYICKVFDRVILSQLKLFKIKY